MPLYDDQSSGSWTPVFTAATPPTGVTYGGGGQLGRWVKQGSLVFYEFVLILTSKGTGGVGAVDITGLPFTARSGNYGAGGGLRMSTVTLPAGYTAASPRVVLSDTKLQIAIYGTNIGQTFLTWADFANTSNMTAGGFYITS